MKKTFRIFLGTALLGFLGTISLPSQALVKWNFVDTKCVATSGDPNCDENNAVNSKTYSAYEANAGESLSRQVTATGWANTEPNSTNNTLEQGQVEQFGSSGIGVINDDDMATSGGQITEDESTTNGGHSVDNENRFDLVLFEFQDNISITEVGIGWFSSDADISLLAWLGDNPPDINGVNYTGTTEGLTAPNGWQLIGNFDVDTPDGCVDSGGAPVPGCVGGGDVPDAGDGSKDFVQAVSTPVSSSYWIVAAYNPAFSGSNEASNCCSTGLLDRVKLLSLAGTIDTPTPPESSVPAPASLALLLGGVVPILRRRRRDA